MNIFYRGYVIHEDIRSICYTIYGPRPARTELASCLTARGAMDWVNQHVNGTQPHVETYNAAPLTNRLAA